ncbi:Activated Cdc42 kinase-like [Clonorchis sinensis]|uniref:non-specific protein-tyrosine kinase n=1 Tax=Clonorchis sinensis TaxID=79923 RepID=A0A8T1MTK9_CLOSI|nr:Activated Cdc42 kinase-like [Clonorchis sinensis]
MLSVPQARESLTLSRSCVGSGQRRLSPTPSEQSYQTIETHPASLFSVSQADAGSDSLSLTTTVTGDLVGGGIWDRSQSIMPLGCAFGRGQASNFIDLGTQRSSACGEKGLFEFLKEAELEHYYTALTTHLKIRSVEQIKYVDDSDLTELGFSRPEQRRLRKFFKRECPQTTMGKLRKRLSRSTGATRSVSVSRTVDNLLGPDAVTPAVRFTSVDPKPTYEEGRNWDNSRTNMRVGESVVGDGTLYRIIPARQLEIGANLGEGEFGKVFQGVWRPEFGGVVQVAVKIVETHRLTSNTDEFLNEVGVMHRLNHPDIVRLYGISVEPDVVKIVTELAPLRSLLECLREPELRPSFPVPVLHRFAVQVARGMAYLEELGLVHRDLAARNLLVFSKNLVKISDFGMSRALQLSKSYYQSNFNVSLKLPIAWCAPECIHDLQFSTASDIWAYGVTLWEMFTYGFTPWAGLTGRQVLEAIDVPRSARLDQPDACPDAIYDAVMRACWTHEPRARPTFSHLVAMLPRLCPERWLAVRAYRSEMEMADSDRDDDNSLTNGTAHEHPSPFAPPPSRSLGRHLSVRENELVYVLGKRSSHLWKVVSHQTGLVGCLPTSILKPYSFDSSASKDGSSKLGDRTVSGGPLSGGNSNVAGGTLLPPKSLLRLSRRASLSDLSFRKTVSRLGKFGSSVTTNAGHNGTRNSRLTADKISLPQNDFRHVAHVGSDGTVFGEVDFTQANGSQDGLDIVRCSQKVVRSPSNLSETTVNNVESLDKPISRRDFSPPVFEKGSGTKSVPKLDLKMQSSTNGQSNGHTLDDLFKSETESDLGSMGLYFGTSLLDEVFKCFSIDPNETGIKLEPDSSDTSLSKDTAAGDAFGDRSVRHVSAVCTSNPPTQTEPGPPDPPNHLKNSVTPVSVSNTSSEPSTLPTSSPSYPVSLVSVASEKQTAIDGRESRAPTVITSVDAPCMTPSLRTRWKRSTFGSLRRRSSSVSKVPITATTTSYALTGTLGRKCSEPPEGLTTRNRLTISPPVLISKPLLPDPVMDTVSLCSRPISVTSSTTSSIGALSSASQSSSLTIVSSTNGHLPSTTDKQPASDTVKSSESFTYVRHGINSGEDGLSTHSSVSPTPSLSSLNAASRNVVISTNPTPNLGLRTLRGGGDVVFRASTSTASGTLSQRRKIMLCGSTATSFAHDTRPPISRIREPTPTGTSRVTDYLANARVTGALLSRLDGLPAGRSHEEHTAEQKSLGRRMSLTSTISSSSSESSPLSAQSPMMSPSRIPNAPVSPTRVVARRSSQPPSAVPCRALELDGNIASFWGSTFADMLNGDSKPNDTNPDATLPRTPSSDLRATLKGSTFKSLYTSSLVSKSRLQAKDDDEMVAM